MATIIRTNGQREQTQPANGAYFSLDELRQVVGGYVEVVSLPFIGYMIVNENGHNEGLEFNEVATLLYGKFPIVGDVLVCTTSQIR